MSRSSPPGRSSGALPTGRAIAARVLGRVVDERSWAAPTLTAEFARHPQLDEKERGLAHELTYGALRTWRFLSERSVALTKHGQIAERELSVLLNLALYQLFFLDRTPDYAVVSSTVDLVHEALGPAAASFANAALRRAQREHPDKLDLAAAIIASVPRWLTRRLEKSLGSESAAAYLASLGQGAPAVGLRVAAAAETDPKATRAEWAERFRAERPTANVRHGALVDQAIVVRGAGRLETVTGFGTAWTVQDEGSQFVAEFLGAKPGEHALDACAGRGHKTSVLTAAVAPTGRVDAADLYPEKLDLLRSTGGPTLGLVEAVDWTQGVGDFRGPYDRILVDAPCSGVGTLRRRPEILLHLTPADITALAQKQLEILKRTRPLLGESGTLVYAVCSVLREESEDVIADAGFTSEPLDAENALRGNDAGHLRLLPHLHGTDGYFVARLRLR